MYKWGKSSISVLMVLGTTLSPAFAATHHTPQNTRFITDHITLGGYSSAPKGFVAKDWHTLTTYLPIYYLMQGLRENGYIVKWNGNTERLDITVPEGISVYLNHLSPGKGTAGIYFNGTLVQSFNKKVEKAPYSGVYTTYIPIWYAQQALKRVGFDSIWVNRILKVNPGIKYPMVLTSNQTFGSQNGTKILNKNALILGTNTTLQNTIVHGNVYVNPGANGDVTLSNLTVQGQIFVESGADHSIHLDNVNATALNISSTSPVHIVSAGKTDIAKTQVTAKDKEPVTFENNGGTLGNLVIQSGENIVLTGSTPYVNIIVESGATVTIGTGANVVNLTVSSSNASVNVAKGANVGTMDVKSGSNVQLQVNGKINTLSNLGNGSVSVSGSGNVSKTTGTNISGATSSSLSSNTGNGSSSSNGGSSGGGGGSNHSSGGGSSGSGSSSSNNSGNAFATSADVTRGVYTQTFPTGISVTNSVYGYVYFNLSNVDDGTLSYNGNVVVTVTDPAGNIIGTASVPISNGSVTNAVYVPLTTTAPTLGTSTVGIYDGNITSNLPYGNEIGSNSITWGFLGLHTLSIGAFDQYVQNHSNTSLIGMTAAASGGGITTNGLSVDNGSNQYIGDVYVEPQSALGYQGGALNNSFTYNLSVSNGGEIYSINGVSVTPAASVSLQYTPGTGYQVNGSSTVIPSINGALPEDFEVGVINSNTGATILTVQSIGVSSTVEIDFVGGMPVKAASFNPASSRLGIGQDIVVNFQVQDVNGNPVPSGTAVEIEDDQSEFDPFWVTDVNGVALQEQFNSKNGTSVVQPTPIPLGQLTTVAPNLNYNVVMPGVVAWNYSSSNTFDVFSNASGDVTLTLQAGQTIYPNLTTSTVSNAVYSAVYTAQMPSGYTSWTGGEPAIGFYTNTNSTGSSVPLYIATTNVSGGTVSSLNGTLAVSTLNPSGNLQGEMNWVN